MLSRHKGQKRMNELLLNPGKDHQLLQGYKATNAWVVKANHKLQGTRGALRAGVLPHTLSLLPAQL